MPEVSFTGLFPVLVAAFAAPFVLGLLPRLKLPSVVIEIAFGIVLGAPVLAASTLADVGGGPVAQSAVLTDLRRVGSTLALLVGMGLLAVVVEGDWRA